MLVVEVEYLMGRVVACSHDDRRIVEWPPHPARLFAAFVAALNEADCDPNAEKILRRLEEQSEPSIYADPPQNKGLGREVCDVFVPVNDPKNKSIHLLPERRSRQLRWFPAFTPNDNRVLFLWQDLVLDERQTTALRRVAENVTYLGHSMSPVRVQIHSSLPKNMEPNLLPHPDGTVLLRTTAKGRLDYLENLYRQRTRNATLQPRLGRITEYRIRGKETSPIPHSLFRHVYILRKERGCRLPLEAAFGLCSLVRAALLNCCADPLPESISGHRADGKGSEKPHLAVVPLANVGHRHADGHIMGFAVLFPDDVDFDERKQLEQGLRALKKLNLGFLGEWKVGLLDGESLESAAHALQPYTYRIADCDWATVTPIVFGHFPKKKVGKDTLAILAKSCRDIGLPAPAEARIVAGSPFNAVPLAKSFVSQDFRKTEYLNGKLTAHVVLRFDTPVQGPMILGAGRFLGLGLCRPAGRKETDRAR